MIIIYATTGTKEEAKKIAKSLLTKHLIACANIFPIESMYRWKEEIQDDKEFAVIMKTKAENFERIKRKIQELHSYDVPLVESWKIDEVNKEYLEWLDEEVK